MNRKFHRGLSVAIAGVLGSAAAHAEESKANSVLEEIVVTAQKREEKIQDVPIAITVIGEEQLLN
jgi:iron complex outermembrane receptor protein